MTKDEFLAYVDSRRKSEKDAWVICIEIVDGHKVEYKAHKTWVQILRIDGGIKLSSNMDIKVSEYKKWMKEQLNTYI